MRKVVSIIVGKIRRSIGKGSEQNFQAESLRLPVPVSSQRCYSCYTPPLLKAGFDIDSVAK
jgi:hypothetical protein